MDSDQFFQPLMREHGERKPGDDQVFLTEDHVAWTLQVLLQFRYLTCSRGTHYKIPNRS
jgi:hypothetical protein